MHKSGRTLGLSRRSKGEMMTRRTLIWGALLLVTGWGAALPASSQALQVKVEATSHGYRETPVSLTVPAGMVPAPRALRRGETPCQVEPAGPGQAQVTWIVRDLEKGKSRTYRLVPAPARPGEGVEVRRDGNNADVRLGGKLFTRYDATTGPNKPYFYPLNGPNGQQVVRHLPTEKVPGVSTDHPHHRGLWFTHGEMNDVDFWTEGKNAGKTVHTGYGALSSGPVYGTLIAKTDWITPDGKKIAEDTRTLKVYNVKDGRLLDFAIEVKAVGGPLVWGDTKEGTFALRVADSMRANAGKGKSAEGKIVNAEGVTGAETWGKAAAWVDYTGPVDGKTVGIAILDSPSNLRHPTYWHVRDYGLFGANPFGIHDFVREKREDRHAGQLTTPEGRSQSFRYRVFIHNGTTEEARIAEVWDSYANPPKLTVVKAR